MFVKACVGSLLILNYMTMKYEDVFLFFFIGEMIFQISWTAPISSYSVIGGTMHVWKLEGMRMNPKWGYCDYRLVDIYTKTEVRYGRTGRYFLHLIKTKILK